MTLISTAGPGLGHVQLGVQIVQNMTQCGMEPAKYGFELLALHDAMSNFALAELRANGMMFTLEHVTSEENENTPEAEAYWRQTSVFFRKVFQAAAAAA